MNMRKWNQLIIFLLFFAVPYLNLFRIDIPSGHYYWMTRKFSFTHSLPLLLTILFLVFVVVGLNFFKPRMFCSYFCPHNTISHWMRKMIKWKLDIPFAILLTPAIAFTLESYFADPRTIWEALTTLNSPLLVGFFVALLIFIALLVIKLRSKFCANVCPYGFFQQLISPEKNSFGKKLIVTVVMLLLASGMVTSALMAPSVEIQLGTSARMKTGPDTMTYTYNLSLINNRSEAETFQIRFYQLKPVGNDYREPITVQASETQNLPLAFQTKQTTQVQFDVCTQSDHQCKRFEFTLSGL